MCKILTTSTTILWTFAIIVLSSHGTPAVGGFSNSSSCNHSTLMSPDCTCSYHNNDTICTVSSITMYRIIAYKLMTTSSMNDEIHAGRDGQLGNLTRSWCASNSRLSQYLQIDLGSVYELWLITTQGVHSRNISGHVTSYKMVYSLDSSSWFTYKENNNSLDKTFAGNLDAFNISCNSLNNSYTSPLVAQFLRIYPLTWVQHICMRIELYGVPHMCPSLRNTCSGNSSCVIFNNSTVCLCSGGFRYDGQGCSDIDECKTHDNITCPLNSTCINANGSFTCVCKHGYYGNANNCTDIDECLEHSHSCSPYAQCINTNGSYSCRCKTGYSGNGNTCVHIDKCYKQSHSCHGNASCVNTAGSYSCFCKSGFKGDGKNCTDIDECSTRLGRRVCSVHSICNNIPGSYYCTCSKGYSGDGHNCTDVDVPSTTTDHNRYLGLAIGLPVISIVLIVIIVAALVYTRYRRRIRVIRRPKQLNQSGSRPSSTVIGQIDRLFDDERKLRDSVSLCSLQFSIPSVHPSLTALNNIGLSTKNYENLQP